MDTKLTKEELIDLMDILSLEQLERVLEMMERVFLERHGIPIAEYAKTKTPQT